MANVFDYLDWRGDISFSEIALCEIDALIFSLICYIDLKDIVPEEGEGIELRSAAKQYFAARKGQKAKLGAIIPPETLTLLAKAAKSKRFSGVKISRYVNEINRETQTQFSAMTFHLGERTIFVAYRGTDDTLVGWKEDFNMSFMQAVPAQLRAKEYLLEVAKHNWWHKIYVGGHSKGGNLAIFASVGQKKHYKDRIERAFSFDGPGFTEGFTQSKDYLEMKPKIRIIIPQGAIVGLLLEQDESYDVVKSRESGLFQHNAFSWELLGSKFVYLDGVSEESRRIERSLREWLRQTEPKHREELFDAIYEVFSGTEATTLSELTADKLKLIKAWTKIDAKSRNMIFSSFSKLFKTSKNKS